MSDDEEYTIPLQDQRVFGAGLKRTRVRFVPSSATAPPPTTPSSSASAISDFYLNLVLGDTAQPAHSRDGADAADEAPSAAAAVTLPPSSPPATCSVCRLPLAEASPRPHEASLAHQVCLPHSHPPSHVDRRRKGLAYLVRHGWDPDARRGLGAQGDGIMYPIAVKKKDDTLGVGARLPADARPRRKFERLDAGRVRKMVDEDKKKAERLRELVYGNEDVERYLRRS